MRPPFVFGWGNQYTLTIRDALGNFIVTRVVYTIGPTTTKTRAEVVDAITNDINANLQPYITASNCGEFIETEMVLIARLL